MPTPIQRRTFLTTTLAATSLSGVAATLADESPESGGPVLFGKPQVSGPAGESICILQGLRGPATGFVEFAVGDEPLRRVDAESAGLLPYDGHSLKFRLPPLKPAATVRYRVTAVPIDFRNAYEIVRGEAEQGEEHSFRTLDPEANETNFVVWNDTHENLETIRALHDRTAELKPDFLLWNGDQTNDIYDPGKMTEQFLSPAGLAVATEWPLAYVRGNHDVRGPAARHLANFTGTPDDRYYYAFRSGPVAALVMDTGEDKPDDHPVFGGLAAFEPMRERQTAWLKETIAEPWFRDAPFKLLFCHIPLWWSDEVTDVGHWRFSKVCRDAWLPTLQDAGVNLIVSGHTHDHAYLPPGKDRPIGQLIGGAPRPQYATILQGTANDKELVLRMTSLDGHPLHEVKLNA